MLMCMCDSGGEMVVEVLVRMHSWLSLQGHAAWLRAPLSPHEYSQSAASSCSPLRRRAFPRRTSSKPKRLSISPARKHLTNHHTDPGLHMRPNESTGCVSVRVGLSLHRSVPVKSGLDSLADWSRREVWWSSSLACWNRSVLQQHLQTPAGMHVGSGSEAWPHAGAMIVPGKQKFPLWNLMMCCLEVDFDPACAWRSCAARKKSLESFVFLHIICPDKLNVSPHAKENGESGAEQSQQAGGSFTTYRPDKIISALPEDVCQHVRVFRKLKIRGQMSTG